MISNTFPNLHFCHHFLFLLFKIHVKPSLPVWSTLTVLSKPYKSQSSPLSPFPIFIISLVQKCIVNFCYYLVHSDLQGIVPSSRMTFICMADQIYNSLSCPVWLHTEMYMYCFVLEFLISILKFSNSLHIILLHTWPQRFVKQHVLKSQFLYFNNRTAIILCKVLTEFFFLMDRYWNL
jgi:hypothetical protein